MYVLILQKEGGKGAATMFTNRRVLADYTGISYHTLESKFARKNRLVWWEYQGWLIVKVDAVEKGLQGVAGKNNLKDWKDGKIN